MHIDECDMKNKLSENTQSAEYNKNTEKQEPFLCPIPRNITGLFLSSILIFCCDMEIQHRKCIVFHLIRISTYCLNEIIAFHRQPLSDEQFQSSNIPLHTGAAKPVRVCSVHGSVHFIRGKMKDEDFDEKNVSTFQFTVH